MSGSSRRGFLKVAGVGGAAVGVSALVPATVASADSPGSSAADPVADLPAGAADAIVVHVSDVRTGELTLMSDGHSVAIRDPKLAAQIASALHRNSPRSVNSSDAG